MCSHTARRNLHLAKERYGGLFEMKQVEGIKIFLEQFDGTPHPQTHKREAGNGACKYDLEVTTPAVALCMCL